MTTDQTHRTDRRSWVPSAGAAGTEFPLQNLPFAIARKRGTTDPGRIGVGIGDRILDASLAAEIGLLGSLDDETRAALRAPVLNALFALPASRRVALRRGLFDALTAGHDAEAAAARGAPLLLPQRDAELLLPAAIGDYTDFYASVHHATNVGSMFRPDNPLLPNYKWVPIGYHGRASSIVPSGTPVSRPSGQLRDDPAAPPVFAPTKRLDYEVEMGFWVGEGNATGRPVPIGEAGRHLAGMSLLNDWSARDIQSWEYQPLGPFLAKNFLTTISPWVVTAEALAPFRVPVAARPDGDPAPLPYLHDALDQAAGAFDVQLELLLSSRAMREKGLAPMRVSRSNLRDLYWTPAQMLAHHASNGCNLRPGDLLGSGTVSGPAPESRACLLERTWRGTEPLTLPTGEQRRFLEDGDQVVLRGRCAREGFATIGFGECAGTVAG